MIQFLRLGLWTQWGSALSSHSQQNHGPMSNILSTASAKGQGHTWGWHYTTALSIIILWTRQYLSSRENLSSTLTLLFNHCSSRDAFPSIGPRHSTDHAQTLPGHGYRAFAGLGATQNGDFHWDSWALCILYMAGENSCSIVSPRAVSFSYRNVKRIRAHAHKQRFVQYPFRVCVLGGWVKFRTK